MDESNGRKPRFGYEHCCFFWYVKAARKHEYSHVAMMRLGHRPTFILSVVRYNPQKLNPAVAEAQPVSTKRDTNLFRITLAIGAMGVLWFVLVCHLSSEWSVNEQYNYGWFVPFFAAYLFWLRWQDRPEIESRKSKVESRKQNVITASAGSAALLMLLPVRLFEIGNPDWRPLGWLHAGLTVLITLALIWKIGGKSWLMHFAFPVAFIFVAVPWVSPVEVPVVQGLMRLVASIASEVLNLCGIPAQLEGSVIRVNTGLVGVNEACSGVRSLQTSLMIGLLFGELKRLSIPRRLVLLCAAVAAAFAANCFRTLFLVWMAATRGLGSEGQWHDVAGYAIIAATFVVTLAVTALLARNHPQPCAEMEGVSADNDRISWLRAVPLSWCVSALCWLLLVEVGVHCWYRIHERDFVRGERWTVRWPSSAPGYRDVHIDPGMQATLRYDHGRQVAWLVPQLAPNGVAERAPVCSMLFFRWNAGGTSILRARSHRPDVCLPNVGWHQTSDHGVRNYAVADKFALPFRHFSFQRNGSPGDPLNFAEAFFCMREDFFRRGPHEFDLNTQTPSNWMARERWHAVLSGMRNPGQQVLELVFISAQPLDPTMVEQQFANDIRHLVVENPAG